MQNIFKPPINEPSIQVPESAGENFSSVDKISNISISISIEHNDHRGSSLNITRVLPNDKLMSNIN